jgi:uncharacterized protein YprB with RNaseH-like and TPR domain
VKVVLLSLKGKLQRYKKYVALDHTEEMRKMEEITDKPIKDKPIKEGHVPIIKENSVPLIDPSVSRLEIPSLDRWQKLHCTPIYHGTEYVMRREVTYPLSHKHGRHSFFELTTVVEQWNERKVNHPLSAASYRSRDLLFFDTETTGLGGGVGNTIFLLGYGKMTESNFIVNQLFLPSPASELGFYFHFLKDIQQKKHLVTYNGKSFDWPQVKTRHTLLRKDLDHLPTLGHFDLLHAARRLWKHQLPSCRLSIIEEQILDFHRIDDTPGYMAPTLYFDFLKTMDPNTLSGVFHHNEWDICSLVTLYVHISKMLLEVGESVSALCNKRELIELGRWFESVGETELAIIHYQKAIKLGMGDELQAKQLLAFVYKRRKEYHLAKKLWEDISVKNDYSIEANIELSKIYEHVDKDYEKALFYAEKAQYGWSRIRKRRTQASYFKMKEEIASRLMRLKRKVESMVNTDYTLFDLIY